MGRVEFFTEGVSYGGREFVSAHLFVFFHLLQFLPRVCLSLCLTFIIMLNPEPFSSDLTLVFFFSSLLVPFFFFSMRVLMCPLL